jgi:Tfp pilus assembly protein PilN
MTRINLLPPEIRERAERPRLTPWFILMGIITVAIIVGLFFLYHSQKADKEDTLRQVQQELEELKRKTKPIETYEAQQKELKKLQDLYKQVNTGRVAWAMILNDLAMCVPEGLATASNPKAPCIWLTHLTLDAQPLEAATGGAQQAQTSATGNPIVIEGYATPAWLSMQTWLSRSGNYKSRGFLDTYPYYYFFKGHPKVAEFFVRLQNMEEWTNLWIENSEQSKVSQKRRVTTVDEQGQQQVTEETYTDWAIAFKINGQWNPEKAVWKFSGEK